MAPLSAEDELRTSLAPETTEHEQPTRPPFSDPDPAALVRRVEGRLRALKPRAGPGKGVLDEALSATLLGRGKRLRPLCAILAARDIGGNEEAALDIGCAVEMVHAASLALDDLPCMDNASVRRAAPATHVRFGQDVAILTAMALLNGAYAVLARMPVPSAALRAELIGDLSDAVGPRGLIGGQLLDLRPVGTVDELQAWTTNDLKTGALFVSTLKMVARCSAAGPQVEAALISFGRELGVGFQLLDDLLDLSAPPETIGKSTGMDANKRTLGRILGPEAAAERLANALGQMVSAAATIPGERGNLRRFAQHIFSPHLSTLGVAGGQI